MALSALPVDHLLNLDPAAEAKRLEEWIRQTVFHTLKKKGAVLGISGGVDSSVAAFLCARALGKDRVIGLLMPEADSSPDSLRLGRAVAEQLGIQSFEEDIQPVLQGARCYERRDEAVRTLVPEFGGDCRMKIVLPVASGPEKYALFYLVVQFPSGETRRVRLTLNAYLGIVASVNFKQRTRKMIEYYYADRYNYAVVGTPNRLEYDLGFFVKNGDGAADLKPIAHLYKSQVYQLAEYLGVPDEIRRRTPTTDTYSLEQTQEEFYFSLPLRSMDVCLCAYNHGIAAADVAPAVGLSAEQVDQVYRGIESKRRFARYLHAGPVLCPSGERSERPLD
jgi:NAD+ synthase